MPNIILLTGATGAMGSVLIPALRSRGHAIRLLTLPGDRQAEALQAQGIDVRFGDVSKKETLQGLCDGVATVLHMAAIIITEDESLYTAINAGGTRNMVEVARAAGCVSHFIHVSSASVVYPKPTPYSISKRLAEDYVRNSSLPWTIVRPTLVCGMRGGQELDMFLGYLEKFPVVPFIGSGRALKRPVHADDVAACLIAIASRERGGNAVYNLSGATAISIIDFAKLLLVYSNKPHKRIFRVPVWLCLLLALIMKRVMKHPPLKWSVIAGITQDADLDPSSAMRDFGYAPRGVESFLAGCFPRNGHQGLGKG